MTALQHKTDNPIAHLSAADIETLGRELDAIRQQVLDSRGERDAAYIRRVIEAQRALELSSRIVLLASMFPPAWLAGTVGLSLAKILENMEIGHNVMHGQWDWMRDPAIHSTTWEWDNVSPAALWKHSHNELHHTYTNVLGKDNDLGYGIMRVDEDQRWSPVLLLQPVFNALNMLVFEYGIAAYDLEIGKVLKGRSDRTVFRKHAKMVLRKIGKHVARDYVLHPLLSGPSALSTLGANVTANLVRNIWTHSVIMCGHFPDGVETFTKTSIVGETRGEWYLRQMLGAANVSGSPLLHLMTGNPVLPDRAPPLPRPAQQPLPGDRAEGAGGLRPVRPALHHRAAAQAGRLGLVEGHPAVAAQRPRGPAQPAGRGPGRRSGTRRRLIPLPADGRLCWGAGMALLDDAGLFGRQWAAGYDGPGNPDPEPAASFLASLAAGGPALELAIGSGRVALPLAARGIAVEGIEASPEMVALLRAKPGGDAIPVVVGDMAEVGVPGPYPLVYLVFNTLFNLTRDGAQEQCFGNVARVLAPGGTFVIEAFVPDPADIDRQEQQVQVSSVTETAVTIRLHRYDRAAQTFVRQTVTVTDGGVKLQPFGMHYRWPEQIDELAATAGLRLDARYAGWDRSPFRTDSPSHVSVYRAPGPISSAWSRAPTSGRSPR